MKDKSSYVHRRLETVKVKLGLLNSYRPILGVSILIPLFSLLVSTGGLGSICGSGRSSGEGNGNPRQYSCLGEFHGQRIPWTEEPDGLQSVGLQRIRNDWATNIFTLTYQKNPVPISVVTFLFLFFSPHHLLVIFKVFTFTTVRGPPSDLHS